MKKKEIVVVENSSHTGENSRDRSTSIPNYSNFKSINLNEKQHSESIYIKKETEKFPDEDIAIPQKRTTTVVTHPILF